ncbi:zinc transporter ZIP3 [Pararge aegeria]|uniref:Jg16436 protein n=2 Tax=Pararge aegeria TaxID=116150 RepID=A0A8S4SRN4_9NEOP|nr:zinc transporter ZIP3 [Pararge aegeria]CAH2269410.1 jg16436 [Pararge aegeria aegeria]
MEVSTAKVISIVALGLGSFITGMAPACISQSSRERHPLLISCLLCFGGGVLLSTSLTHMLPEAREKLPEYTEVLLCIGFFLVYVVDEIVHFFYGVSQHPFQRHERVQRSYGTVEQTLLERRDNDSEMRERCCGDTGNPRMCHVSHTEPCNKSSSGVIGLLCALFVHSLLEGLAIGLQESASQVLLLLGAVASHKYVVGFCLGAELCASSPGRLCAHIICVSLFSGGSVAGIAIGAAIENVNSLKDSIAVPIMQALAAGTLLYVTVSEVLPRERARWHERKRGAGMAQFVAVALGFAVMYLLTMYLDHDAA